MPFIENSTRSQSLENLTRSKSLENLTRSKSLPALPVTSGTSQTQQSPTGGADSDLGKSISPDSNSVHNTSDKPKSGQQATSVTPKTSLSLNNFTRSKSLPALPVTSGTSQIQQSPTGSTDSGLGKSISPNSNNVNNTSDKSKSGQQATSVTPKTSLAKGITCVQGTSSAQQDSVKKSPEGPKSDGQVLISDLKRVLPGKYVPIISAALQIKDEVKKAEGYISKIAELEEKIGKEYADIVQALTDAGCDSLAVSQIMKGEPSHTVISVPTELRKKLAQYGRHYGELCLVKDQLKISRVQIAAQAGNITKQTGDVAVKVAKSSVSLMPAGGASAKAAAEAAIVLGDVATGGSMIISPIVFVRDVMRFSNNWDNANQITEAIEALRKFEASPQEVVDKSDIETSIEFLSQKRHLVRHKMATNTVSGAGNVVSFTAALLSLTVVGAPVAAVMAPAAAVMTAGAGAWGKLVDRKSHKMLGKDASTSAKANTLSGTPEYYRERVAEMKLLSYIQKAVDDAREDTMEYNERFLYREVYRRVQIGIERLDEPWEGTTLLRSDMNVIIPQFLADGAPYADGTGFFKGGPDEVQRKLYFAVQDNMQALNLEQSEATTDRILKDTSNALRKIRNKEGNAAIRALFPGPEVSRDLAEKILNGRELTRLCDENPQAAEVYYKIATRHLIAQGKIDTKAIRAAAVDKFAATAFDNIAAEANQAMLQTG